MSFVTDNPGSIMTSRSAGALLADIHKRLFATMSGMESRDYFALLHKVRDEIIREEQVDSWVADDFAFLGNSLAEARFADELGPLHEKLLALTARHFSARSSVSALHEFSGRALETLLATAMAIAGELSRREGEWQPDCDWSLFASDCLGRREATLKGHLAIIFIHEDGSADRENHCRRLALRLEAILGECGILLQSGLQQGGQLFWHGPVSQWRRLMPETSHRQQPDAASGPAGVERHAREIEIMADIRPLCGNMELAARVTEMTRASLDRERDSERFRQLARRVATMPVALGIFGRFRTARSGEHRGEFSLEEMAIRPLVSSARIMAIACGIRETSTTARLKALQAGGQVGVALVDRLLVALHDFARCQIELEIAGDTADGEHYFNPYVLGNEERERLKAGLEDLTTLQRLVYQQVVEVG